MIRIEIGAMPPLLRSIVSSALQAGKDLEVMPPAAPRAPGSAPRPSGPDVLVVCSDREPDASIPLGHLTRPHAPAIVAIDSEGQAATILRVTSERATIAAAGDLCDAIRLAARPAPRVAN